MARYYDRRARRYETVFTTREQHALNTAVHVLRLRRIAEAAAKRLVRRTRDSERRRRDQRLANRMQMQLRALGA